MNGNDGHLPKPKLSILPLLPRNEFVWRAVIKLDPKLDFKMSSETENVNTI